MNGLTSTVHVLGPQGEYVAFSPDDDLPDWAVEAIGEHCFEDGKKPTAHKAAPRKQTPAKK